MVNILFTNVSVLNRVFICGLNVYVFSKIQIKILFFIQKNVKRCTYLGLNTKVYESILVLSDTAL